MSSLLFWEKFVVNVNTTNYILSLIFSGGGCYRLNPNAFFSQLYCTVYSESLTSNTSLPLCTHIKDSEQRRHVDLVSLWICIICNC